MGLGILEDRHLDHVPGTTRHYDDPNNPRRAPSSGAPGLKTDKGGIILVPQPSDDPNDPLNWPLWQRDLITAVLSITAIFATSLGPILAANTITLSLWFTKDITRVALLTGYFLLGCGAAGIFFVPSSRIWGKRHAFVLGLLILVASSAWGGAVGKNYDSMVGARIVQGVGAAPYEALVNAVVGDLYCVHQRGMRMAATNLAVFGGAFFTPVVVGVITHSIKWWWSFYLVAIFSAACLPLVIFYCPETAYRRDQSLNTDMVATDQHGLELNSRDDSPSVRAPSPPEEEKERAERGAGGESSLTVPAVVPSKMTFRESIALFNGRKTDDSFWKLLFRPFVLLIAHPAFLWASLIQGTMIGWTVFIGVILGNLFLGPPLWWNEVQTGYAYAGPFVGAVVGFLIVGALSDWSAKKLTKWNGGIYEPEFRILLIIPQLILGCASLYGFGATADAVLKNKAGSGALLVCFGAEVAAMVIGAVASSLYIVDAYRDLSIEGFTCMIIFKNFFSYALTNKAYDWWIELKTVSTPLFNILGTVQLIICLSSIPMYIYGKRVRSFYHRHDILAACGLR